MGCNKRTIDVGHSSSVRDGRVINTRNLNSCGFGEIFTAYVDDTPRTWTYGARSSQSDGEWPRAPREHNCEGNDDGSDYDDTERCDPHWTLNWAQVRYFSCISREGVLVSMKLRNGADEGVQKEL